MATKLVRFCFDVEYDDAVTSAIVVQNSLDTILTNVDVPAELGDIAATDLEIDGNANKASFERNDVQFPRLLEELSAIGTFNTDVCEALRESTDLSQDEIDQILDRAQAVWDEVKSDTEDGKSLKPRY